MIVRSPVHASLAFLSLKPLYVFLLFFGLCTTVFYFEIQ